MKFIFLTLLIFCSSSLLHSQQDIDRLIREGVEFHDEGEYEKAISLYEQALKLDSKSALANYEISLTYFTIKNYQKAIDYSDVVLKQKDKYMIQAYLTKGSALDLLGRTKESIKLFKKAIKKTKGHYLLHYNLALNYLNLGNLKDAEESVLNAIDKNSDHASSHIMLANIHLDQDHTAQALMSLYYFLYLEPNSERSIIAYNLLQSNFGGNVSQDATKPNTINISLSLDGDPQFSAIELMISMLAASRYLEENEDKSEDELFVENTTSFFTVLGELKDDDDKGIWWEFYTPFFYELSKSEHMETYCKFIGYSVNEESKDWLIDNTDKVTAFITWIEETEK